MASTTTGFGRLCGSAGDASAASPQDSRLGDRNPRLSADQSMSALLKRRRQRKSPLMRAFLRESPRL
jgi:hypothetical protein